MTDENEKKIEEIKERDKADKNFLYRGRTGDFEVCKNAKADRAYLLAELAARDKKIEEKDALFARIKTLLDDIKELYIAEKAVKDALLAEKDKEIARLLLRIIL